MPLQGMVNWNELLTLWEILQWWGTSWSSHSQGVRTTRDHLCYQAIGPKSWQLGQDSNRIYHTCNHPSTPHTRNCSWTWIYIKTLQTSWNTGKLMPNFPGKPLLQKILKKTLNSRGIYAQIFRETTCAKNPKKNPIFQGNLCPNFQWKHLYKNLQVEWG